MQNVILAAEFYPKTARRGATLAINTITNGVRALIFEYQVADKREARKIAAARNATCWNF
jgi:hypothetical protein